MAIASKSIKWSKILGHNNYMISDCGRVLSINYNNTKKGKVLKSSIVGSGYLGVMLNNRTHALIHRLVAQAFIPNHSRKQYVNHIDGDKTNNHHLNLEWCTHAENMLHARNNKLLKVGEGLAHSKLKNKDVFEIIALRCQGCTHAEIAQKFKVSRKAIADICIGKNWSHLTGIRHEIKNEKNINN